MLTANVTIIQYPSLEKWTSEDLEQLLSLFKERMDQDPALKEEVTALFKKIQERT